MQNGWIIAGACALMFLACGDDGGSVVVVGTGGTLGVAGAAGSSLTGGIIGSSGGAANAGGTANAGTANASGGLAAGGTSLNFGGATGLAAGGTSLSFGGATSGFGGVAAGGSKSFGGTGGSLGFASAPGQGGMAGSAGTTASGGSMGAGGASPVAFFDDFEDGNSDGWSETTDAWRAVGGTYGHEHSDVAVRFTAAGDSNWTDVDLVSRVMLTNAHDVSSSSYAGACARVQDPNNNYCIVLRADHTVVIRKTVAGSSTTIGPTLGTPIETGVWHTIRIKIVGSTLNAWFGGLEVGTVVDSELSAGGIGLVTRGASAEFDEVSASPP